MSAQQADVPILCPLTSRRTAGFNNSLENFLMSVVPPRNATVDVAKAFGILLVVFGHNWIVDHYYGELTRVMSSFRMPLFFFVSGVFLTDSKSFGAFFRRKADALLKPYFMVMAAVGVVLIATGAVSAAEYIVKVVYANGQTIRSVAGVAMVPLWFLPSLFVTDIFSWMVLRLAKHAGNETVFVALSVVILLALGVRHVDLFLWADISGIGWAAMVFGADARLPDLPFSIDLIGITAGFMLMGYLLRNQVRTMRYDPLRFFAALVIFASLHYFFDESIDLNKRYYGHWLIASAQAFLGIYLVISVSELVSRNGASRRILAYIGSSGLFILMFHSLFQYNIFNWLSNWSGMNYMSALVALGAGIVFPLVLLEIAKRQSLLSTLFLPMKPNGFAGVRLPEVAEDERRQV